MIMTITDDEKHDDHDDHDDHERTMTTTITMIMTTHDEKHTTTT